MLLALNCWLLGYHHISLHLNSVLLCIYYRPPSSGVDSFNFLSAALMSLNPTFFDKLILLGDCNVNYFCSGSFLYSHLMYTIAPIHLTQSVTSGTHVNHSGNTTLIDYVFVSDISFLSCWSLIPPLGNSDHNGIQVETYFEQPAGNKFHLKRKVWCFDRGDYSKMKQMINSFSWNQILSEDISSSFLTWQTHFFCIMEQCIPRKTLPYKKNTYRI